MNNTETYTFRPADYPGYVIRASWSPAGTSVVTTAPNGTESGVLPSVTAAEDWMVRHFQAGRFRG